MEGQLRGFCIFSADGTTVTGTDGNCTVVSAADFEGATSIADGTYSNYVFKKSKDTLISVTFPSRLTTIGDFAFADCNKLTGSLNIPDSVTTIGNSAFQDCSALDGILFTNKTAYYVGNNAFSGDTVFCYSDSSWAGKNHGGTGVYFIDSISTADLTLDPGNTETITVTPNIAASASYIPSITWASSNTSAATLAYASTAQGVMTNTLTGITDVTSTITITAAQVGSDIFGAAAVPAIPSITITATVGSNGSNIPNTGGDPNNGGQGGGVSGTQNSASLDQYETPIYATPVVSANGNTALVITNTHYPELVSVTVIKSCDDDDDRDHYRPSAICITLTAAADSVEEEVWNQTLSVANVNVSDANEWDYTFEDMVKFYDGYQIAYTLAEDSGSCAAQVAKTAANCEISGGRWENNACTPFSLYDPATHNSNNSGGGSLEPANPETQSECQNAGYIWQEGSCSDNAYSNQAACEAAEETWFESYCDITSGS